MLIVPNYRKVTILTWPSRHSRQLSSRWRFLPIHRTASNGTNNSWSMSIMTFLGLPYVLIISIPFAWPPIFFESQQEWFSNLKIKIVQIAMANGRRQLSSWSIGLISMWSSKTYPLLTYAHSIEWNVWTQKGRDKHCIVIREESEWWACQSNLETFIYSCLLRDITNLLVNAKYSYKRIVLFMDRKKPTRVVGSDRL